MTLSQFERLMLANQFRILETLRPVDAEHYGNLASALELGYTLEYADAFEALGKELSIRDCEFVSSVLDMFLNLHAAMEEGLLDASDKFVYLGFSSKLEYRFYAYAQFLLRKKDRWTPLKEAKRDSVMPKADYYRYLLSEYSKLEGGDMSREGFLRMQKALAS